MNTDGPVIIVDDDADDHYIFREMATELDLTNELRFFWNGQEMLSYLRQTNEKPFIIFCDVNMPRMNGLELRREINADQNLARKSIPFVFFSTAASRDQVFEAYELTVQGFFLKEPAFEETIKTFKLVLDYWKRCLHPNRFS